MFAKYDKHAISIDKIGDIICIFQNETDKPQRVSVLINNYIESLYKTGECYNMPGGQYYDVQPHSTLTVERPSNLGIIGKHIATKFSLSEVKTYSGLKLSELESISFGSRFTITDCEITCSTLPTVKPMLGS